MPERKRESSQLQTMETNTHPSIKTIAVAIVTHNAEAWLPLCLGSLRKSRLRPAAVVVVDNASTDGTAETIRRDWPEVELIVSERNLGFGKANNLAFRAIGRKGADAVYLLNQDAAVAPDTLGHLADTLNAHPRYGLVSPIHLKKNGRDCDSDFRNCLENNRVAGSPDTAGDFVEVSFVNAAHWLVRMECLERLGGFAPIFFHYGEDTNFVHRMLKVGWKVGIDLGAKALHCRDGRPGSAERDLLQVYAAFLGYACNPLIPAWRAIPGAWRRLLYNLCAMEVRPPRSFSRCIRHALADMPGIMTARRHIRVEDDDGQVGASVLGNQ